MEDKTLDDRLLMRIKDEKEVRRKIQNIGDRDRIPNLDAISKALDKYLIFNKIRLYCGFLNYNSIINRDDVGNSKFLFLNECYHLAKESDEPIFRIYYLVAKILEKNELRPKDKLSYFEECLELIASIQHIESREDVIEMYSLLNNYCLRKINDGQVDFTDKFFEININLVNLRYSDLTERQIQMEPTYFKNLVTAAILIDDEKVFDRIKTIGIPVPSHAERLSPKYYWLEHFVAFFGRKLGSSSFAKAHQMYCNALVQFEQEKYNRAYIIFSNKLHIRGAMINLSCKMLHLKILFEIYRKKPSILRHDGTRIETVLDSFRKLIRSEERKERKLAYQLQFFQDFLKYYKWMYSFYQIIKGIKGLHSKEKYIEDCDKMIAELTETKHSFSSWLLKKIRETREKNPPQKRGG